MPDNFFFTSYARLDNNKYTKLGEAVDELSERVRSLTGLPSTAVGFFDVRDIETAEEWVNGLGEAVAKCRVFVCFCSNTYFNREVCGKEFEVFRTRMADAGAGRARYIFPIIWDKCELPAAIQRFNLANSEFPKEYLEDGLCSLQRLRREAEYKVAIDALAEAIAAARFDPELPHGKHPVDFDAVASAFDNPDPDAIRVGVLHDDGVRWRIELARTVRAVAEEAAASERVGWRQMLVGDDVVAKIVNGPSLQPTVIVAPPVETLVPAWKLRLQAIDDALAGSKGTFTAMVIGTQPGAAPDFEAAIRAALPNSAAAGHLHATYSAGSARSLRDVLRATISRLRMEVVKCGDVARVQAESLEEAALRAGVPTASQPMISGPGARM